MLRVFLFFVLVLFAFTTCKKNNTQVDLHYDYFPVKIGSWVSYKVDSIGYDDFTGVVDTSQYFVKELIESHFQDNQGRKTLRIERYFKDSIDGEWYLNNVWKANRLAHKAEKVEENLRFTKLIFPIREKATWDGNVSNILQPQEYSYTNIHEPYTVDGLSFDSTITVLQAEETSLFTEISAYEIYAKHIGCVFFKRKHLNKEADGTIISGHNYTYRVLSWSH